MRYYCLLLTFILVGSCQFIEPRERAATIYRYKYVRSCACCDNLGVRVGANRYQTRNLPKAFATDTISNDVDSLRVWIRYKDDDSECGRVVNDLITITSMRLR